jgi:hypothetical protein
MTTLRHPWDIGQLLERLSSMAIYSVELLENEFGPYGFVYDRVRGELWNAGRTVRLPARSQAEILANLRTGDTCELEGDLDEDPDEDALVDASEIIRAVFRLLHPGVTPPSSRTRGADRRRRGYEADLAAIQRTLNRGRLN